MADINGNTALWDAIASKHDSIFRILYQLSALSDPHTAGDLLCTASKRNDLTVMNELLKQGLNIDSKDHHGLTAIQVAMDEHHVQMVQFLLMNGSDVAGAHTHNFSSSTNRPSCSRVSIYRGNPILRKENGCMEAGKLIRLPNSLEELKKIAGKVSNLHKSYREILDIY